MQLCGPHFRNQTFVVKCDNEAAVDQSCAQFALEPQAEHIAGVLNRLADWLSRQQREKFEKLIRDMYGTHVHIHYVQVSGLRNYSMTEQLLLSSAGISEALTAPTTPQ